jgi:hypothetical protein
VKKADRRQGAVKKADRRWGTVNKADQRWCAIKKAAAPRSTKVMAMGSTKANDGVSFKDWEEGMTPVMMKIEKRKSIDASLLRDWQENQSRIEEAEDRRVSHFSTPWKKS